MALRFDPTAAALLAGAFTKDNADHLEAALGRAPSHGELYTAHVLGPGGAVRLIEAAQSEPAASAAALFPAAAKANRHLFYDRGGEPRSVSELLEQLASKVSDTGPMKTRPVEPDQSQRAPDEPQWSSREPSARPQAHGPGAALRAAQSLLAPTVLSAGVVEALWRLEPPSPIARRDQDDER